MSVFITHKLFKHLLKNIITSHKKLYNEIKTEYTVPTFCDLKINLPCRIEVKPLDVHKYPNCDKLFLELSGADSQFLKYFRDGSNIIINSTKTSKDAILKLKAPVKSNLDITSQKDIHVGFFNGDKLKLETQNGNISLEKFQGDYVDITTKNGNINFHSSVQSTNLKAAVLETGSITTEKLQCLNTLIDVNEGDINVQSSYCDESIFKLNRGKLDLCNIHKSCKIILEDGILNLSGFDGILNASLGSVIADIQISRFSYNSNITIKEHGNLILKLAKDCLNSSNLEVIAKNLNVDKNIELTANKIDNETTFLSTTSTKEKHLVSINCKNSEVKIESASWKDMLMKKYQK